MIIYLEQTKKHEWNIVGIPTERGDEMAIHLRVRPARRNAPYALSQGTCVVLDKLFWQSRKLYWKSREEQEAFISASRSFITYRIHQHSEILPDQVIQMLNTKGSAAPAAIAGIMKQVGLIS